MHAEIGAFILLDAVDRDWLGEVHRAFDTRTERIVRLRLIPWPTASVDRQALMTSLEGWSAGVAALDHPNVGAIHSVSAHEQVIAVAGDWAGAPLSGALDGCTLDGAGTMPLERAHRLMAGILLGLGRLHRDGLVHGTLNPAAILVDAHDSARLCEAGLQCPGRFSWLDPTVDARWPHGRSPEELAGEALTARSDLYGAGMLLHRLLTGRHAFEGAPSTVMQAMLTAPATVPSAFNPELGTRFDAVIARATAVRPQARFGSASEFLQALNAAWAPPRVIGSTAANAWPPEVLAQITALLAEAIGPMAKMLVAAEGRRATDLEQLAGTLASRIDDVSMRNRFLRAVRSELPGGAGGGAFRSRIAAPSPAQPSPAQPAPASTPPTVARAWPPTPDFLARLKSELAAEVGPMAGLLVDRAAAKASSRREFLERLSAALPGLERRPGWLDSLDVDPPGAAD